MSGLKEEFLELLERDREFRYAVAGFLGLGEILKRLDMHEQRLVELREEAVKLREDMIEGFKRYDEEIVKLREDMVAGFKRHDEQIAKLREDMNRGFALVERHISALGARWGIMSEEAFREGLKAVIEREFNFRVERWRGYDDEGKVFGYPSLIEIDVAVHDEKIILIKVKSHVDASDVFEFKRKVEFYEEKTKKGVARKIIVTPYAEEKAFEAALKFGIEVYTKV
ncbi:MAG: PD-(D/E)XK nuclease family protein [Nitrososphaeria archaeon]